MTTHTARFAATLALGLAWGTLAFAQGTGSQGYFEIHNNTDANIVVGFYTNDGTGWSQNWLDDALDPGDAAVAEFAADTGNCDQLLRVGWAGADGGEVVDEPIAIDICAASNIYVDDNEIFFD
tara:strand:+ start:2366 stop:2734 length:369 start_codon:yes stop_codon:yes gene_type:complete